MATWDVTVQGIPLNTLAYQVDVIENRRGLPGRVDQGLAVAGFQGETSGVGSYEPTLYGIAGWIDAVNPTTGLQPADWESQLETNISVFLGAFQKRNGILDVQLVRPDGRTQRAYSKVAATPQVTKLTERTVRVNIALKIPSVFWEGLTTTTDSFTAVGSTQTLANLVAAGSTGVVMPTLVVHGPTTGTTQLVTFDGATIWLTRTLAANEVWIADSENMRSVVGVEITSSTQGVDVMPQTSYAGSGARLLEMWPTPTVASGQLYRAYIASSAGAGTAPFAWSLTAKPTYA